MSTTGTEIVLSSYAPTTTCPVLTWRIALLPEDGVLIFHGVNPNEVASTLSSYALAMRCPVLTYAMRHTRHTMCTAMPLPGIRLPLGGGPEGYDPE
eukprot:2548165-Rhodomonas_salina.2